MTSLQAFKGIEVIGNSQLRTKREFRSGGSVPCLTERLHRFWNTVTIQQQNICMDAAASAKCVPYAYCPSEAKQDGVIQAGRCLWPICNFAGLFSLPPSRPAESYQRLVVLRPAVPGLWTGCSRASCAAAGCTILAPCRWASRRYSEQSRHVLAQIKQDISKDLEAGVQLSAHTSIETFHHAGCVSGSNLIKLAKCSSPKWVLYCQTSWKTSNSASLVLKKYIFFSLLLVLQMLIREVLLHN